MTIPDPNDSKAVERLAWHLFTETDDMDHPPTAELTRSMWANPRYADLRARFIRRAHLYLQIARGDVEVP